jgi:hypothetical protein
MERRAIWVGLALAAGLVALCDAVQPLVLEWKPKLWGAMGGALLYAVIAMGAWRERRAAAVAAMVVPVLPISILAATLAGVEVPARPDAAMIGILAIQLVAATLGAVALRGAGS